MRKLLLTACLAASMGVSGCANLLSIHRQHNITPAGNTGAGAEITLIDAKQRAVISVRRMNNDYTQGRTVVCAEPSPDALQAVAASTAITAQDAERKLAQIANSLSEAASNIGLRTQSIQLLRDAMFRICEGYAAHAIDDDEVTALHRRYQNLMLGLLAVEQLTGAVTASQVALFTNGAATAGAAGADLAAAQTKVKEAKNSLATDEEAVEVAKGQLEVIRRNEKKVTDQIAAEKDAAKLAELREQQATLERDRISKIAEVGKLEKKAQTQRETIKDAEEAVLAAKGRLTAATGAQAQFDGKTGRGLNDPGTAKEVAGAVKDIITQIVSISFLQEACFGFLERAAKGGKEAAARTADYVQNINTACVAAIRDEVSRKR